MINCNNWETSEGEILFALGRTGMCAQGEMHVQNQLAYTIKTDGIQSNIW